MRWQDLMWFVLSWAVRRRPREEREQLFTAAMTHIDDAVVRQEVQTMSQQVQQSWEEELLARGQALGRAQGETHGLLRARRDDLRAVLEERFGALPEALVQQIETTEDLERLQSGLRQAVRVQALGEFQL